MIFTGTFRRPKTGESEKILLKLTIEKTSWITLAGRRKKINRQTRIMTRHTVGEGTVPHCRSGGTLGTGTLNIITDVFTARIGD